MYEAARELVRYVADRTDIALGLFNTHAAGWILTPDESARLVREFPAICAVKNGMFRPAHTAALHRLVPRSSDLGECDMLAFYRGGFLQRGIAAAGILGGSAFLYELPNRRIYRDQWELLMANKPVRGGRPLVRLGPRRTWWSDFTMPSAPPTSRRPTPHWGSAFKTAAATLGLPVGDYPRSRPPQPPLPDSAVAEVEEVYRKMGYVE